MNTRFESAVDTLFRTLFFWEKDPKRLGTLIRFAHHSTMYCIGFCFFLVHTFLPSYWLLLGVYICLLLIWFQHVSCGGCVVNRIERKYIGDSKSFVDPILDAFHIPITDETTKGITILGSTAIVGFLSLELTSRTLLNINHYLSYLPL